MTTALIENLVHMPVVNPRTGYRSHTFEFYGVVDRVDPPRINDWKSGNPARFIKRATIGCQAELYAEAVEHATGATITEVAYRLIDRPTLKYSRPRHSWAVMRESRKTALKVYDNEKQARTLAAIQNGYVESRVQGDATRQVYEDRCLNEWLLADPTRIVDHTLQLTGPRRQHAKQWLWDSCKRILECHQHERWLPNAGACYVFERECPYMGLCECESQGGDVAWIRDESFDGVDDRWPELGGVVCHKTIVTHSSLTCRALCEKKYYWKYVAALRPKRDDAEARWIGSAMHVGLAAYSEGGLQAACDAVDAWADQNPVLGEDAAWKQDEQIAKARAMVRAAAVKWPIEAEPEARIPRLEPGFEPESAPLAGAAIPF